MLTEAKVEQRDERHYAGIRTQAPMNELGTVIPQRLGEVYGWLAEQGLSVAGPPFIRYWVIDMEALLDIELGFPVATPILGDGHVRAGVIPAGRYAALIYTGVRNGIPANAALLNWAAAHDIVFQTRVAADGEEWGGRFEFFLTDPEIEPDMAKWQTEVAFLVAEA